MPARKFSANVSSTLALDAIREHAPFWEESLTPWALRQRGRLTVVYAERRDQFSLRLPGGRADWFRPILRGHARARADGGCDIVATVGLSRWAYISPAVLFAFAVNQIFSAPPFAIVLLIAAMWHAVSVEGQVRGVRANENIEANFLLQRLRIALDTVNAVERE